MANIITIRTVNEEPWVETSPNDPTTQTLTASAATTITSEDIGPWTVSFPDVPTAATVPPTARDGSPVTATTVTLTSAGSQFVVDTTTS
jgi:hypothetical protein